MARSRATIPCLCFLLAALIGGVAIKHWHSLMLTEISIARRSGAKFESMYRNSLEELNEWHQKYDEERRKTVTLTDHIRENEGIIDKLKQKGNEDEITNSALLTAQEKMLEDLNKAANQMSEEQSVREEVENHNRSIEQEVEQLRTANAELEEKIPSLCTGTEEKLALVTDERDLLLEDKQSLTTQRDTLMEERDDLQRQVTELEAWKENLMSATNVDVGSKKKGSHHTKKQHSTEEEEETTSVSPPPKHHTKPPPHPKPPPPMEEEEEATEEEVADETTEQSMEEPVEEEDSTIERR